MYVAGESDHCVVPEKPANNGSVPLPAELVEGRQWTSLLHHLTPELLRSSFFDLKKHAAPGIDGETWRDYTSDFERRIEDLHGQIIAEFTGRSLPSGRTSLNQMAKCDRWELLRWRIKSSNKRRAQSWNVSMKKTSLGSVMDFVPDAVHIKPWMHCL